MEDLDELTRQLDMLNDLPTEDEIMSSLGNTVTQPTISQPTVQQVGVPQTPENPLNLGVVTNSVVQPIQSIMQEQVNQQAQAQVVQPTQTNGFTQPIVPTQQPTTFTNTTALNQAPKTDLSLFDNDDEEPVFVNIGEAVQESKVPFVDLKPGEATRVMLFTKAMLTVHTHYINGIGSIRCLSKRDERGYVIDKAPCCMFEDEEGNEIYAKIRRILPVIEYPVSKDGKSLIANGKPQLKFMVISLNDIKSLNAILLDEEKAQAAMGFDFLVTIDKDDRFKTKVFSSTFNTIRAQWPNEIQEEIKKCTKDLMLEARDEKFRKVPAERIYQALQKEKADKAFIEAQAAPQPQMFGSVI